jgi:hypothetical protein
MLRLIELQPVHSQQKGHNIHHLPTLEIEDVRIHVRKSCQSNTIVKGSKSICIESKRNILPISKAYKVEAKTQDLVFVIQSDIGRSKFPANRIDNPIHFLFVGLFSSGNSLIAGSICHSFATVLLVHDEFVSMSMLGSRYSSMSKIETAPATRTVDVWLYCCGLI